MFDYNDAGCTHNTWQKQLMRKKLQFTILAKQHRGHMSLQDKKASHCVGGAHCQPRLLPLLRLPTARASVAVVPPSCFTVEVRVRGFELWVANGWGSPPLGLGFGAVRELQ
jgi:hypothetical protein